jgi:hydrogenase maturation factor HypE
LGRRRVWLPSSLGPGIGVGLALGALGAASAYSYAAGCHVTREAVRDVYGNFLYSRPVRVCD